MARLCELPVSQLSQPRRGRCTLSNVTRASFSTAVAKPSRGRAFFVCDADDGEIIATLFASVQRPLGESSPLEESLYLQIRNSLIISIGDLLRVDLIRKRDLSLLRKPVVIYMKERSANGIARFVNYPRDYDCEARSTIVYDTGVHHGVYYASRLLEWRPFRTLEHCKTGLFERRLLDGSPSLQHAISQRRS